MSGAYDFDWARKQLEDAGVSGEAAITVMAMLASWDTIDRIPDQVPMIMDAFKELAQGHSIAPDKGENIWIAVEPGDLIVTDTIRIKRDAYEGKLGQIHNGRIGRVVAIRRGDIIVRSIDGEEPTLEDVRYMPDKLEKLVK